MDLRIRIHNKMSWIRNTAFDNGREEKEQLYIAVEGRERSSFP
jgi:hypothetical protein